MLLSYTVSTTSVLHRKSSLTTLFLMLTPKSTCSVLCSTQQHIDFYWTVVLSNHTILFLLSPIWNVLYQILEIVVSLYTQCNFWSSLTMFLCIKISQYCWQLTVLFVLYRIILLKITSLQLIHIFIHEMYLYHEIIFWFLLSLQPMAIIK